MRRRILPMIDSTVSVGEPGAVRLRVDSVNIGSPWTLDDLDEVVPEPH